MTITEGYNTFIGRCAEGRHMTKEAIEKIAEGRVWTGEAPRNWVWWTSLEVLTKHWISP